MAHQPVFKKHGSANKQEVRKEDLSCTGGPEETKEAAAKSVQSSRIAVQTSQEKETDEGQIGLSYNKLWSGVGTGKCGHPTSPGKFT